MQNLAEANENQLEKLRAWFFKENIRLNEEREQLERERMMIRKEEELFEKKVQILKKELYSLALEKQKLEKEKILLGDMKANAERNSRRKNSREMSMFFSGVGNELALKKRYRDLLKIYHPDNLNGDTETVRYINEEYNNLKAFLCDAD